MKKSTYAEIVNQVQQILLTTEGREKIDSRRRAVAKMADGLRELNASGWVLNARRRTVGSDRTVFSIRQGSLQKAAKGLEVSVELRGNGVGTLLPPSDGNRYPRLRTSETPSREFEWGGNEALEYMRACSTEKKPSPERDLQGVFVRDMASSPKHKLLENLQPACPANCMMEIPTAVQREGKLGTGNIDILARTGRGRSSTFIACELKVDRTKPYEAMVQAIRYAAALDVEVNGIENEIEAADRTIYLSLFGSGSTSQRRLRFGAMAILPNGSGAEDAARRALKDMEAPPKRLDVMLFDQTDDGKFNPVSRLRDAA